MPPKPVSQDQLQAALDAITKYGSPYLASKEVPVDPSTLRDRKNLAERKGLKPSKDITPYQAGDSSVMYGPNGEIKLQWIKRKGGESELKQALHDIFHSFKEKLPRVKPTPKHLKKIEKDVISVIPWGDPHFGLLCDPLETGEAWDLEIAERTLVEAVQYLITKATASERLVLINLGDFFHADSNRAETYNGTRLDVDSRLHRVIRAGVRAVRTCITEGLKKFNTVEFITVQGNHDDTMAQFFAEALDAVYDQEPRVTIHSQPTRRKYLQFGKVLIGAVHGDKQNENKLAGIMATEQAERWGQTTHRVFFKGHLHHDKITEYNGMKVEMVRTLAPNDEYATSGGWLSKADMKMIVYHNKFGEIERHTCPREMLL